MEVVELKVAVAVVVDAAASREAASTKVAAYEALTFKLCLGSILSQNVGEFCNLCMLKLLCYSFVILWRKKSSECHEIFIFQSMFFFLTSGGLKIIKIFFWLNVPYKKTKKLLFVSL